MAPRVSFKQDSKRNPAQYATRLRRLAQDYAERVQHLYSDDVTGTWEHQPEFPITELSEDDSLILNVGPAGDDEDVEIFRYVDEGTDVRYARMSNDFVPKSSPGRISSGQGRGGFLELDFLNRPGIQAREFGQQIVEQLQEQFASDVRAILGA